MHQSPAHGVLQKELANDARGERVHEHDQLGRRPFCRVVLSRLKRFKEYIYIYIYIHIYTTI